MSAPTPTINVDAKLAELVPAGTRTLGPCWYITHGLGGPAAGTFTEVAFTAAAADGVIFRDDARDLTDDVLFERVVREVAVSLYGTAWAFLYRPREYDDAIGRHGMKRRERVVVEAVEVFA